VEGTLYVITILALACLLFYLFILHHRHTSQRFQRHIEQLRKDMLQAIDEAYGELVSEVGNIRSHIDAVHAAACDIELKLNSFTTHAELQSVRTQFTDRVHRELKYLPTLSDIYNIASQGCQVAEKLTEITNDVSQLYKVNQMQRQVQNGFESRVSQLQRIFDGAQSRGAFGEYLVAQQLKFLPPSWIAQQVFFSNGSRVEFAIRTPTGQIIPIDSKWTATELLLKLDQATDFPTINSIVKDIQQETINRARETIKYRDDYRTAGFCIVAVPDRVFECSQKIQPKLISWNVVLMSYSLLIPYILILVNFLLSNARGIRVMETANIIEQTLLQIEHLQEHVDDSVRTKLDAVKRQQAEYRGHDTEIRKLIDKIDRMQEDIAEIQANLSGEIVTVDAAGLSETPNTIQYQLTSIRETLLEINTEP